MASGASGVDYDAITITAGSVVLCRACLHLHDHQNESIDPPPTTGTYLGHPQPPYLPLNLYSIDAPASFVRITFNWFEFYSDKYCSS